MLKGAKRTVPMVSGDERTLAAERRHSDAQEPPPTAGEGTPPDVGDCEQERRGDGSMRSAKGKRARRELPSRHHPARLCDAGISTTRHLTHPRRAVEVVAMWLCA